VVRFGEARSRRDLVWYGEAGEARCDKAGRYQVWHGPVSHGPVRQVRRGEVRCGLVCRVLVRRGTTW